MMLSDSGLLFMGHPVHWFYPYRSFKHSNWWRNNNIKSYVEYL